MVSIFFVFSPVLGEMIQFDDHIFQMGWFNHQLWMDHLPSTSIFTDIFLTWAVFRSFCCMDDHFPDKVRVKLSTVPGWVDKSVKGMWTRNVMAGLGFGISSGVEKQRVLNHEVTPPKINMEPGNDGFQ